MNTAAADGSPVPAVLHRPYSAVQLLVALLLLIVSAPFVRNAPGEVGGLIQTGLMTLVLLTAVPAAGGGAKQLALASVLAAPAMVSAWINHYQQTPFTRGIACLVIITYMGWVTAQLLRFIIRSRRVTGDVLCAAVAGYLLLGILWALAYTLTDQWFPDSFRRTVPPPGGRHIVTFDMFYFSFITLSSVGYGDITPASDPARMLAVLEGVTGTFYIAILIASLVTHHGRDADEQGGPADGEGGRGGAERSLALAPSTPRDDDVAREAGKE